MTAAVNDTLGMADRLRSDADEFHKAGWYAEEDNARAAAREIAWLRRLLVWCRARLKRDGYQELLDRYLAEGPTDPDDTKVVRSDAPAIRAATVAPNEAIAEMVETWHQEFFGLRIDDLTLGELQRRIATLFVEWAPKSPVNGVTQEQHMKALEIPEDVIDQVVAALNAAIGVTSVHAKDCHKTILEAALALDEAIQDAEATEA